MSIRSHVRRMGAFVSIVIAAGSLGAEEQWPRWRGPSQDGHAASTAMPTEWSASSVVWRTPLKGRGQSSPIVWNGRIFLTTDLEDGKERFVFAVDGSTGKVVWEHKAWEGTPEPSHVMNGWASASCATDGEVVAAFFGKGGLHVLTTDGRPLWSTLLGAFENPWGTAACPILVGDLLIQNGDSDVGAFLAAFDKKTGKPVWRTKRPDFRGWSTPIVLDTGGASTVIALNGHEGVIAYDAATGRELWRTSSNNGRGEPSLTPGAGLLFVVCGLAGDMVALRPATDPRQPPERVWSSNRRGGRDLPSPIVVGSYVLVSSLNGIMTCYDTASGNIAWKERLEGQFSSSPIAIGDRILHQSESGETFVIEPGPALKIVARNKIGEGADELFRASLTPIGKRIYARSNKFLYGIE
ncbi:MAG: hypothetical protein FJ297_03450 [Planctomycetes bacterium]|nr:hypothetical protein [Planctomycetota bacterium]